jgi:Uma2 family endonuclease
MTAVPLRRDVHYPESDGKPMGETEIHIREIMYLFQALNEHLRGVPDVYIGANLLLYYVEGDPKAFVVPDVFVAKGVPRGERRVYKLWEEGRPPCLVIEVTSRDTWSEDLSRKKNLYARLGVAEYFIHDPLRERLSSGLQGYRLHDAGYRPLKSDADGSLISETTGLILQCEHQSLRLIDAETAKPLPSYDELAAELDRLRRQS